MSRRGTHSELVDGKKDRQIVLRLPEALLQAVQAHQAKMQAAEPYDHVTLARAVRDLLARAVQPSRKRR